MRKLHFCTFALISSIKDEAVQPLIALETLSKFSYRFNKISFYCRPIFENQFRKIIEHWIWWRFLLRAGFLANTSRRFRCPTNTWCGSPKFFNPIEIILSSIIARSLIICLHVCLPIFSANNLKFWFFYTNLDLLLGLLCKWKHFNRTYIRNMPES